MDFKINVWRGFYDEVQELGQYLKDASFTADGKEPKIKISLHERRQVENEIKYLTKISNDYLDKCKIYPKEPKWIYSLQNKETWASDSEFIYHDLMPKKKHMKIPANL